MDKNTPLTFELFENYFKKYMDTFRGHLDNRFDSLENRLSQQIEDLAFATKTGFDHMDTRFDSLEEQIGDLAFASKTGFDNMDEQFTDVKMEIRMLQGDITDTKHHIQSSSLETASNRVRLQHLEAHIA